ncbi:MAG: selenide, water dikinase SelD [Acidobacteria bacterium]|nr:selenide, water dikinase SelD [Acidobacteriota bacterium]
MAKLAPSDLAQVLSKLPPQSRENVIVGYETSDDAGVMRLDDETALVQTVDFFTPVSDDPFVYGQVAAVNALNDVYAMGGRPLSALSIVCYPQKGDWDILEKILLGGQTMMNSEGVVILGGHSVDDQEMKFGYAVTGTIRPDRVFTNAGAKPGDVLVLTKPIGTGAINTAIKRGAASEAAVEAVTKTMTASAKEASKAMCEFGANASTDVTGFGLLGHAFEMAKASNAAFEIESGSVPLLVDTLELIAQGMLTRGDKNNRAYTGDTVEFAASVSGVMQSALFDPQTAGGLLISTTSEAAENILKRVETARVIGRVKARAGDAALIEVS